MDDMNLALMAWINAHADGFALLFWAVVAGFAFCILALLIEWRRGASMRSRARQRRAIQRYNEANAGDAWPGK